MNSTGHIVAAMVAVVAFSCNDGGARVVEPDNPETPHDPLSWDQAAWTATDRDDLCVLGSIDGVVHWSPAPGVTPVPGKDLPREELPWVVAFDQGQCVAVGTSDERIWLVRGEETRSHTRDRFVAPMARVEGMSALAAYRELVAELDAVIVVAPDELRGERTFGPTPGEAFGERLRSAPDGSILVGWPEQPAASMLPVWYVGAVGSFRIAIAVPWESAPAP